LNNRNPAEAEKNRVLSKIDNFYEPDFTTTIELFLRRTLVRFVILIIKAGPVFTSFKD
jgi:hypothetical protein